VAIIELTRLSNNSWIATEIAGSRNGELGAETLARIQQKLEEHAIPSFAPALPSKSVRAVARLINSWELMHDEALSDPPLDVEEPLEEHAA
jgi:hypothetical protein